MFTQPSFTVSSNARHAPPMKARQNYTLELLRDDICWLENRIRHLQASNAARERKLAECYRKLLRQRQYQLASSGPLDAPCPGCWNEYFY